MKKYFLIVATFLLLSSATVAFASTGTIDVTNHYAWNDNGGWVNWYANGGNVVVTDTTLTGYIWSADFGWINLAPTDGGVTNDGSGNLGGWAWGANTGWISFSGVTIDSNGVFHGHTVAQNVFGTMTFDCDNCDVVTTWRPGTTSSNSGSSGGGGDAISGPLSYGYQNGTTSVRASTTTTTTLKLPPTLIPKSAPPKTQPTTKPPSSPKSSAYTSQQLPTPQTISTSTVQTNHANGKPIMPTMATPISRTCSWFGSCLWQTVTGFFGKIFGWL